MNSMYQLLLMLSCTLCKYFPSKYDPKAYDSEIMRASGYIKDHQKKIKYKEFGDLSLLTLNMQHNTDLEVPIHKKFMLDLIDSTHPTIFALQDVASSIVRDLPRRLGMHYLAVNIDKGMVDMITSAVTYLPILYDTRVLKLKKSGYFTGSGGSKQVYGSWAKFAHKATGRLFTVINIDLYSAFKSVVDAEMANIINDIQTERSVDTNPVIIMGTINSLSEKLEEVFKDSLQNVLEKDKNNKGESKATFLLDSDFINDIERDYIILRDRKQEMIVNLARILNRRTIAGHHYPVHAILTFKKKK